MQAITIIVVILTYLVILFQYRTATKNGARDIADALADKDSLQSLNRRTINTTPLMLLSLLLCLASHQDIFFDFSGNEKFAWITIALSCLCFFISVYSGLRVRTIHRAIKSPQEAIVYLSCRIPGLMIYEIFFRGVLLEIFLERFSNPVAIILNLVLYAIAHAFSSRREFLGSFLFGLMLCYITVLNQSIYPAVLVHLCLALPYETILLTKRQLLTKKF
jgi:membrane protease YdiL (CAAX protease family)